MIQYVWEHEGDVDTMSNWRVELTANSDNQKAIIDVMDTVGPLNRWRCVTDDAFIPDEGEFTNQARRVVPLIPNFWQLDDFDIDEVQVGSAGPGEVFESGSSFPNGPVSWRVVKALREISWANPVVYLVSGFR